MPSTTGHGSMIIQVKECKHLFHVKQFASLS